MTETFADLGLKPELVEAVRAAGYEAPAPLQRSAVPVLRRGGNAVLYASPGAGVVAAYGLGLLDRLVGTGEGQGPRALVVTGSDAAAGRIALSLARLGRRAGVAVGAVGPGWAPGVPAVVVAGVDSALREVETSRLKLESLDVFVLDSAAAVFALGFRDMVETLMVSVPRDAQRVVVTAEATPDVESYVERHVRRALWIPGRPAVGVEAAPTRGVLRYAVAPDGREAEALAELIASGAVRLPAAVHCRTRAAAEAAANALELRGFAPGVVEAGLGGAVFGLASEPGAAEAGEARTVVSYDVPFDAETLAERHGGGGVVLVLARELPHLRQLAAEAGFALEAVGGEAAVGRGDLDAYRALVRRAVREEDLGAQILVLEPLLSELSAVELAAALSALLRRRTPVAAAAPAAEAPAGPAPRPWVRLFVSAGQRDHVRPGDLVGAITGEAGITGEEVGRIDIRDTFSIVEVAAESAERVIQALNGVTLKGRSLRVDYDRRPAQAPRRPRGPGGS
jgi:ATP-dependent RNA helicase DeaD